MSSIGSLVLLGASGDLAGRCCCRPWGSCSRRRASVETWSSWARGPRTGIRTPGRSDSVRPSRRPDVSEETTQSVLDRTRYTRADVTNADDLRRLIDSAPAAPALYFALPPAVTVIACTELKKVDLPTGTTLVLEKPFGTNAESAASLNGLLAELVPDEQVFRVDHFLGRSSVLNLLGVRFANRLFEPLWSNEHIARVDITYDEVLALENRARYYDHAGALTDMVQSHLLQILALIAMDPPANVNAIDLRYAKATALRACRVWDDDPVAAGRRARYTSRDGRRPAGARLRRRARGRSGPQHRNARRAHGADRQLALGRGAVPAAVGKGSAEPPQGGADHLQAAAAPARRAARGRSAGPAAPHAVAGSDGRGDEREQPERPVRAGAGRPHPRSHRGTTPAVR